MISIRPIREDELQAYVDGRLSAPRRAEVDGYLLRHPQTAARVAEQVAQRERLRLALTPLAEAPIPPRLDPEALVGVRRRKLAGAARLAAAASLLLAGVIAGWTLNDLTAPPANGVRALAREAADNYRVYAHDERPVELDAARKAELLAWVSDRLGGPVAAPDLGASGYGFIGGRLVTTPHGPAALFLYQSGEQRLGVLVRPMRVETDTAMSRSDQDGLTGVSWASRGIGYSLVAPQPYERLHVLADEMRRQLTEPT